MEPFALFNLLQSLLSGNTPTPTAENTDTSSTLPTEEAQKNQETTALPTPSQEAALRFLTEHENRVKRAKKS